MLYDHDDPRLTAYALGELEPSDREAFEAEIADDFAALAIVAEIAQTAKLLMLHLAAEPSPGLGESAKSKIETAIAAPVPPQVVAGTAKSSKSFRRYALHYTALAASVIVVGGLTLAMLMPSVQSGRESVFALSRASIQDRLQARAPSPTIARSDKTEAAREEAVGETQLTAQGQMVSSSPRPSATGTMPIERAGVYQSLSTRPGGESLDAQGSTTDDSLSRRDQSVPAMTAQPNGPAKFLSQASPPAFAPSATAMFASSPSAGSHEGRLTYQPLSTDGGGVPSAPASSATPNLFTSAPTPLNQPHPPGPMAYAPAPPVNAPAPLGYAPARASNAQRQAYGLPATNSGAMPYPTAPPAPGTLVGSSAHAPLPFGLPKYEKPTYEKPKFLAPAPPAVSAPAVSSGLQGKPVPVDPRLLVAEDSFSLKRRGANELQQEGERVEGLRKHSEKVLEESRLGRSDRAAAFGKDLLADEPLSRKEAPLPENPFIATANDNLSTFSIDVDTASYANIRRFLNQNQMPPARDVRIEEMINYFTYDDPSPTDDKPFSVNVEVAGCPWNSKNRLARISLKGKAINFDKKPPSNLVFLIDVSGSMNPPERLPLIKSALPLLVEKLGENDRVAIVVYAGREGLLLKSTSCDNKREILSAIENLQSGGSTNGAGGITLAYEIAVANFIKGGINRVILATDGDFNVGITNDADLQKLIEEKRQSGVFLSVLGVGTANLQDKKMEMLADKGNGNYNYLDTIQEARKVLVEEVGGTLVTIAKDVKIQVDFNLAKVKSFRLVGYENRMLQHQDFANDKKDAGEIGAGHNVTALYELVPVAPGEPVAVRPASKFTRTLEIVASDDLMNVKLRYKEPDGDVSTEIAQSVRDGGKSYSEASSDFKFASSVASFGMLLRNSASKGSLTYSAVLELAQSALGTDKMGYGTEFVELVKKAKTLQNQP